MPLELIDSSITIEDVIKSVIDHHKKTGRLVRIVTPIDVEGIVTSGFIARALKSLDVGFEIVPEYLIDTIHYDGIYLSIKSKQLTCSSCVNVIESNFDGVLKRGEALMVHLRIVSEFLRKALSEFTIIPKEVRYLIIASILTKHTPRIKDKGLSKVESEVIESLIDEGLIDKVDGPKIMGWGILEPEKCIRYSLDIMIPKYFLSNDEIPKELVNISNIAKMLSIKEKELMGVNYVIRDAWVSRDLYLIAYMLMYLADIFGVKSVVISYNPHVVTWAMMKFLDSLTKVKEIISKILDLSKDGAKKTEILYQGNFSYMQLKSYLNML